MNPSLRSHVAAALLLLPAATAFVAAPAAAQHRVASEQPAIRTIAVDASAGLAPGSVLRVQVQATPGAQKATATLAGGVRVVLREKAPGQYAGTYTVRRGDRIDPRQRITARANYGDRAVMQSFAFPAGLQAQAMGNAGRADERPPRITEVTPADGERMRERGRTFIRARLSDQGTGVDPRSVRLFVDGLDVTADAQVTAGEVSYRERLGRGRHRAELLVKDRAGNVSRLAWSFHSG